MPFGGLWGILRRKRSKAGRELDKLYQQHKIGWAHYNKICNKSKYWEWEWKYRILQSIGTNANGELLLVFACTVWALAAFYGAISGKRFVTIGRFYNGGIWQNWWSKRPGRRCYCYSFGSFDRWTIQPRLGIHYGVYERKMAEFCTYWDW